MWSSNVSESALHWIINARHTPTSERQSFKISPNEIIQYKMNRVRRANEGFLNALFLYDNIRDCSNVIRRNNLYYVLKGTAENPRKFINPHIRRNEDRAVDEFGNSIFAIDNVVLCDSFIPKIIVGKFVNKEYIALRRP